MAVQYIPKNLSATLTLPPVRRSTRRLALATTTISTSSSANANNSRVVAGSPSPNTTRRKPRQSHATTTSTTIATPVSTPVSRSRSRKRSRPQDEPDQKEQDLQVESCPPTPSPRTRLATIIDNMAPLTPEPTPRAIRAQKRRKLSDSAAASAPASGLSSSSSSSPPLSPSHLLSPATPLPQPISPEPFSPHSHSDSHSPYMVKSKSRPRKRKLEDDVASSSSSDTPSSDPLPRSLAKRRKLDRTTSSRSRPARSVRIRSKSKSSISSSTPPTPLTPSKKRTSLNLRHSRPRTKTGSVSLPRAGDNNDNDHHRTKNVRRSARLLVHTGDESQCPSETQLKESSPLSPLTPPPSEDDESDPPESTQLTVTDSSNAEAPSSSEVQSEEEDDTEMEMIACIAGGVPTATYTLPTPHTPPPTSWKAIIPGHISNPILKGRPPPNPALYAQLQLASYRRTKPNTPSPLSLYSYTDGTPPTSPTLSAATINSLDAIDNILPLGETAAVEAITAIAEGDASLVGLPFHEQPQQPQMQFYGQGYSQVESPQHQQQHSLPGQVFEQSQSDYRPPANAAAASSPTESSDPTPPLIDMGLMMMDLQFQMQLQHLGIQGSAEEGIHFGVDQMGFMMGGNAAEERSGRQQPTTVHMQDVHLHQQPHQNQNHQLYPYPYFSTEQQAPGSNHLYGTQVIAYGGESQPFQSQPEFQQQHQTQQPFQHQHQPEYPHQHQEQSQAQSSSGYEDYGGIQPYATGPPQVYEQPQQDFQAQQQQQHGGGGDGVVPPFSSSNIDVGYDAGGYQTQTETHTPSTSVGVPSTSAIAVAAPVPVPAATTPISHYTLSMHNALLYFQQSHSRFHEDQQELAHDAADMQVRQLEEFQREKEERKRRLKRTKLVREVQIVPMGSSGAAGGMAGLGMGVGAACSGVGRARGLWAVACKARMFEVVRIYTPALIREVTEISAREYYRRMGLKYPPSRVTLARYRRRVRMREDDMSISDDALVGRDCDHEQEGGDVEGEGDDVFDGLSSVEKKDEVDGDADGEEFRKEKIFDFELLDDDEECEEDEVLMDEVQLQMEDDLDVGEEMDDEDDEDEDEDGDEGDEEAPKSEVDLDLEAITDPHFQPELSMRITPQEPMPSTSGGVETAFYVPPVEVYAVPEQNTVLCEDRDQDPDSETQPSSASSSDSTTTTKRNQKHKVMLFHRPVLPLPPPALSTFRPTALRFYNIDPVHAGRGTPCVKERREVWAGGPLFSSSLSFSVRRVAGGADGSASSEAVVNDYPSGVTAWYAYAEEVQAKDGPSSTSSLTAPGSDPHSDARSVPACAENDDSVFGDCVGTCCTNGNAKGKTKEVGVGVEEGEKGGVGEEQLEERGEEARGDDDGPSSTSTASPRQPIAQPPPQPPRHLTVEIPPAHSDRIPHRRRGVVGRTELLKVYAPPPRSVPSILPLARRPPRPPPPSLGLGLDETDTANSVARSPQTYHPHPLHYPVVPYSWEQVAEAMEVLAYQGIDASVWVDGHGHPPAPLSPLSPNGTEVPTFNPSSSELSTALG